MFKNYKVNQKAHLFGKTHSGSMELVAVFDDSTVAESYVMDSMYEGQRKRSGLLFRPGSILRNYEGYSIVKQVATIELNSPPLNAPQKVEHWSEVLEALSEVSGA